MVRSLTSLFSSYSGDSYVLPLEANLTTPDNSTFDFPPRIPQSRGRGGMEKVEVVAPHLVSSSVSFNPDTLMKQKVDSESMHNPVEGTLGMADDTKEQKNHAVVDARVAYPDCNIQGTMLAAANTRSNLTQDSQTAALAGIPGLKKKRASLIMKHGKHFLKRKGSKANSMKGVPSAPGQSDRISGGKSLEPVREQVTYPISDPKGPATAKSEEEEWDSESSGSYASYDGSQDYSQSTSGRSSRHTVEDSGIFSSIMASSERALGSIAQSFDKLFVADSFDESDDDLRTIGSGSEYASVERRRRAPKIERRRPLRSPERVPSKISEESTSSDTTQTNNRALSVPRAKPMKRNGSAPRALAHRRNEASSLGDLAVYPIERKMSEEEIAAETMVIAVESWFGTRYSRQCTPTRVRCPGDGEDIGPTIDKTIQRPVEPTKSSSPNAITKPTPLVENPKKEEDLPEKSTPGPSLSRENELKIAIAKSSLEPEQTPARSKPAAMEQHPSTPDMGESRPGKGPKQTVEHPQQKTRYQADTQNDESPAARVQVNSSEKRRSPLLRGRGMGRTIGEIWRASRASSKDKKHPREESPATKKGIGSEAQQRSPSVGILPETPSAPQTPKQDKKNEESKIKTPPAKQKPDESASTPEAIAAALKRKSRYRANNDNGIQHSPKKSSTKPSTVSQSVAKPPSTMQSSAKEVVDGNTIPASSRPQNRKTKAVAKQDAQKTPVPSVLSKKGPSEERRKTFPATLSKGQPTTEEPTTKRVPGTSVHPRAVQSREKMPVQTDPTKSKTKRQGILSAIRRKGMSLLNSDNNRADQEMDGLKTTIIMTTNRSSLNPTGESDSSDSTLDASLEDKDSTLLLEDPENRLSNGDIKIRPTSPLFGGTVETGTGFFCTDIPDQCSARCDDRLENPDAQQKQICHFSPADPFVSSIQGHIEAFVAGLTGSTPDRSLVGVSSTEGMGRNLLCANSEDSPKNGGLCDQLGLTQVEQTSQQVGSQDIHAFLETYKDNLELKIRNTFSLEYFDGAMAQASKDWSNLAVKATQNDQMLTESDHKSTKQENTSNARSVFPTEADSPTTPQPGTVKSPTPVQENPKSFVESKKEAKKEAKPESRPRMAEVKQKKLKRRSPSPAVGDKPLPRSRISDETKATRQEKPSRKATGPVPEMSKLAKQEAIYTEVGQKESPKKEAFQSEIVKKEVAGKGPVKNEATKTSVMVRKAPSPGLEKPKSPQREISSRKISSVPKQSTPESTFPVTIAPSPKDTWPDDEQKQESDDWVPFESKVFVTASPRRLVQDLSRRRVGNEEEKVSTPDPTLRQRSPVDDLVFPVRAFSADGKVTIAQRNAGTPRSFAC